MSVMKLPGSALLALCLWLGACANLAVNGGETLADTDCASQEAIPWQPAAPSVWVWLPAAEVEVAQGNAGHVAPTAVVVDGGQALVVDPGPSHRHGLRVRESLRCQFGARVTWVVNTHAHAENVLANSAFADLQSTGQLRIGASQATRDGMTRRCPDCLASLTRRVGELAMENTRIVLPDATLETGMVLRVGQRELTVWAVEQGHTEGDLVLWDALHGVLFAGGLVYGHRIPELAQGQVDAWLAALDRLALLPVRELIGATWSRGGGGRPPPAIGSTRGYLGALRSGVLRAMDQGAMAQDTSAVPLPGYSDWAGYVERHGFNVLRAWRELEPVWMEQDAASPARSPGSVQQPRR